MGAAGERMSTARIRGVHTSEGVASTSFTCIVPRTLRHPQTTAPVTLHTPDSGPLRVSCRPVPSRSRDPAHYAEILWQSGLHLKRPGHTYKPDIASSSRRQDPYPKASALPPRRPSTPYSLTHMYV